MSNKVNHSMGFLRRENLSGLGAGRVEHQVAGVD